MTPRKLPSPGTGKLVHPTAATKRRARWYAFVAFLTTCFAVALLAHATSTGWINLGGPIADQAAGVPPFGEIDLPITGDHTVTSAEFRGASIQITGALSADVTLTAPLESGAFKLLSNATTGGHSVTWIGASGTGVTIPPATSPKVSFVVHCPDGLNWVSAGGGGGGGSFDAASIPGLLPVGAGYMHANGSAISYQGQVPTSDLSGLVAVTQGGTGLDASCLPGQYLTGDGSADYCKAVAATELTGQFPAGSLSGVLGVTQGGTGLDASCPVGQYLTGDGGADFCKAIAASELPSLTLTGDTTATISGGTGVATTVKVNGVTYGAGGALTTGTYPRVTGSSATTYSSIPAGDLPTITLTGDTTGAASGGSVATTTGKVNGTTYPSGGSLTTGNICQVSGSSAVTYAPLNLAGGAGFITGVLPDGNQAAQSLSGDVTGTTAASLISTISGSSSNGYDFADGGGTTVNITANEVCMRGDAGISICSAARHAVLTDAVTWTELLTFRPLARSGHPQDIIVYALDITDAADGGRPDYLWCNLRVHTSVSNGGVVSIDAQFGQSDAGDSTVTLTCLSPGSRINGVNGQNTSTFGFRASLVASSTMVQIQGVAIAAKTYDVETTVQDPTFRP